MSLNKLNYSIVLLGFLVIQTGWSQIEGRVVSEDELPIPGVSVFSKETSYGTYTDVDGKFLLQIPDGKYTLIISSVGFRTQYMDLVVTDSNKTLSIKLDKEVDELNEVLVVGKSLAQQKREEAITIDVLSAENIRTRSSSPQQLLNATSGVKVRQAGGLGSDMQISINGLQGNAIRFFRDDIPLDYLGRAFDLSILPLDNIEQVEIYKGVLPVALGSDALGGGINIVQRNTTKDYLDVTASAGSFNTYKTTMNGMYSVPNSKISIGLTGYYINSENNFKNEAPIVNQDTGNRSFEDVERFHDGIESIFFEVNGQVKNTSWADLLTFRASYFDLNKEEQNGVLLTNAFGEVASSEKSKIVSVRYKKGFGKLEADVFAAYTERNNTLIDTTGNRYNFRGEVVQTNATGGELGSFKSNIHLDFDIVTARLYLAYPVSDALVLFASHNYIGQERIGSNPPGQTIPGTDIDPLTVPASYDRNISALGIDMNAFDNRLKNTFSVKRYAINTKAAAAFQGDGAPFETSDDQYGISNAIKWSFSPSTFLRSSYEYAIRIPEPDEFFGDGLFIQSNVLLEPERSHNVNLGFQTNLDTKAKYSLGLNGFYRFQEGLIFLRPQVPFSRYENVDDAEVLGLETSFKGNVPNTSFLPGKLSFYANITYQDIRRVNTGTNAEAALEGSRVPNIPFFFTSLGFDYEQGSIFQRKDKLRFFSTYNYTHQFYLFGLPKSQEGGLFQDASVNSSLIIPEQHVIDAGISYKWGASNFWINLDVNNLLDADIFDEFRVPRPGINYTIRLRYLIN